MNTPYKSFAIACSSQIALLEFSLWVLGSAWFVASAVMFFIFQYGRIDFAGYQNFWLCANLPIVIAGTALFARIWRELSYLSVARLIPGWQQSNKLATLLGYTVFVAIPILVSAILAILANQAWSDGTLYWYVAATLLGYLLGVFWTSVPVSSLAIVLLFYGYAAVLVTAPMIYLDKSLSTSQQLQKVFFNRDTWSALLPLLMIAIASYQKHLLMLRVSNKLSKGSREGLIETYTIGTLSNGVLMSSIAFFLSFGYAQKPPPYSVLIYLVFCWVSFNSWSIAGALPAKASFLMWLPSGFQRHRLGQSIFLNQLKRNLYLAGVFTASIAVLIWIYQDSILMVEKPHWICLFIAVAIYDAGISCAMFRPKNGKWQNATSAVISYALLLSLVVIVLNSVPQGSAEPASALLTIAFAFGLLGLYAGLRHTGHWSKYELQDLLKPASI